MQPKTKVIVMFNVEGRAIQISSTMEQDEVIKAFRKASSERGTGGTGIVEIKSTDETYCYPIQNIHSWIVGPYQEPNQIVQGKMPIIDPKTGKPVGMQ